MKLFINASNLRFGGGKTVGINIVNYYLNHQAVTSIVLVAPQDCGYERFSNSGSKLKIVYFPKIFNKSVFKLLTNYAVLPSLIRKHKPDFVLSLGNIAVPTSRPQFLLIQQSYLAYPDTVLWQRLRENDKKFYFYISNMVRLIAANLKYADVYGVQTEVIRERLHRYYKIPLKDICVVPNAISFTTGDHKPGLPLPADKEDIKLLFLSKYYPHKNYEILYEVGKEIVKRNLPVKITVTLDANESESAAAFLENIRSMQLDKVIVNAGNVKLENISSIYAAHHGLFLPTLLESYSGSYVEAMHFEKPVFTSDMDFAHEVCKDAAYYFDPLNKDNILQVIMDAFKDPATMKVKIEKGKSMMSAAKTWDDIGLFIDKHVLKL